MTVPYVTQFYLDVTSVAAAVTFSAPIGPMPFAGTVTLVQVSPAQTQTADTAGAATLRSYCLYNRGGAPGTGTTSLARGHITSLIASQTAFGSTSGGLTDNIASTLVLTTSAALLTVAAGDILEWESSTFSGGTGLRDVGGRVVVTLSRI